MSLAHSELIEDADRPEAARPARTLLQYAGALVIPLAIAGGVAAIFWFVFVQREHLLSVAPSPTATFNAREGDIVTADFTLTNITDDPIRLLGANTSCGCTVVTTEFPMELQPGASAKLLVQMKVEAPDSNGKFKQEAHLFVNREGMVPALVVEAMVSNF